MVAVSPLCITHSALQGGGLAEPAVDLKPGQGDIQDLKGGKQRGGGEGTAFVVVEGTPIQQLSSQLSAQRCIKCEQVHHCCFGSTTRSAIYGTPWLTSAMHMVFGDVQDLPGW